MVDGETLFTQAIRERKFGMGLRVSCDSKKEWKEKKTKLRENVGKEEE